MISSTDPLVAARSTSSVSRTRLLAVAAWTVVAVWIGWIAWSAVDFRWGEDVPVFWAAGRAILAGANPYAATELLRFFPSSFIVGQHELHSMPFLSLPWVGLAFVPLALVPLDLARPLWALVNVALLVLITLRLIADLGLVPAAARGLWSWQCAALVAGSLWLALACFRAGQFGILLLAGLALLLLAAQEQRTWLVGPAVLLLSFKLHVVFPILAATVAEVVLRRQARALLSLLLAAVVAAGASTIVLPHWWHDYAALDFLTGYRYATTVTGERLSYGTASAGDWLRITFGLDGSAATAAWLAIGAACVTIAGWLWWQAANGRQPRALAFAAAVCVGLLVTPYARQYDYAVLVIPFLTIWSGSSPRWRLIVQWVTLAGLVGLTARGGDVALAYWLPLVFLALLVLAALIGTLQRKTPRQLATRAIL